MTTAEEIALQAAGLLSGLAPATAGKVADSLRQSAQVLMAEVGALRDTADAIEAQAERLARHAAALEGKAP